MFLVGSGIRGACVMTAGSQNQDGEHHANNRKHLSHRFIFSIFKIKYAANENTEIITSTFHLKKYQCPIFIRIAFKFLKIF